MALGGIWKRRKREEDPHPAKPENAPRPDNSIPLRLGDLVRSLGQSPGLTRVQQDDWEKLARLVEATFHEAQRDHSSRLQGLYGPLDPDADWARLQDLGDASTGTLGEFLEDLDGTLVAANFRRLDLSAIEKAVAEPNESGLNYLPQFELFDELRVYVRGMVMIPRKMRSLKTRFKTREIVHPGYRRMVVAFKFRHGAKDLGPLVHEDCLYLRLFKDVPRVDMEMHLPEQGTRVKMRLIDKAQIASPVAVGLPPVLWKIVAGGLLFSSFGALSTVLIAPFSVAAKSFFGFQRAKTRHLLNMIRHLYYLNLANNSCVLDRIVHLAHEEDTKEALLAYYVLWRRPEHDEQLWSRERLDREIERLVLERSGCRIDFEIGDAMAKLQRLGLLTGRPEHDLRVIPINEALTRLDERWDRIFQFNG